MNALEIIKSCHLLGVMLLACSGKLTAQPASMLTCELRDGIKLHRAELLELLAPKPKRAIVRFKLKNNGGGGIVLGENSDTVEMLIEVLKHKFADKLEFANV